MLTGCASLGAACPQPLCLGARGLSVFATVVCMDLRQMGVQRAATMLVAGALGLGLSVGLAGCNGSDAIVTQTPTPTPANSPSGGASVTSSPSASASGAASPGGSPGASDTASADASTDANPAPLSDEELLKILPEYADRTDLQGAVVTAEFFIQEFPRMFSSEDSDVWESLSLPGCDFCVNATENMEKYSAAGWVVRGGEISSTERITEADLQDDESAIVTYSAKEEPIYVTEPDSAEREASPGSRATYYLRLERIGETWKIRDVNFEVS